MQKMQAAELLDALPDATVVVNASLDTLLFNQAAKNLLRLAPSESNPSDSVPSSRWVSGDAVRELRAWIHQRGSGRDSLILPVEHGQVGAITWAQVTKKEFELDGEEAYLLCLREVRGPQLQYSEEEQHYRRLGEAIETRRIGIYEHNHLTGAVFASGEVRRQCGLDDLETLSVAAFVGRTHPDDAEYVFQEIQNAHDPSGDGVFNVKHRVLTEDGESRWLHTCAITRFTTNSEGLRIPSLTTGSVIDITSAHLVEEKNRRLAAMLDASPDLVATTDLQGRLIYLNPAGREMAALGPDKALGGRQVTTLLHPTSRSTFSQQAVPAAVKDGIWRGELGLLGDDGRQIPISMVLLAHQQTRSMGAYLSLVAQDLSAQKELESRLLHSHKLEAVGRLAGGVAHDFNNLLSVILGFASLASEDEHLNPKTATKLREIRRAAERAAELTSQLLSFSRKQVLQPKVVSVNAVLEKMVPMLERLVGEAVALNMSLDGHGPHVRIDPGQLEQLVMNLVVNSRDAVGESGRINIETRLVRIDEQTAREHADLRPGAHVAITVSDTGVGMDVETRQRIFEPFFTTKERGRGSGLGLATVFGIVKQSGGTIWVDSEPSVGTTFQIYFPATDELLSLDGPASIRHHGGEGGQILVVEDESQLRDMIEAALTKAGYVPLAAASPADALEIAREKGDQLDLILTDVVMPQMTGKQLADALVAQGVCAPVLFMSGYTGDAIASHGVLEEGLNFLPKPLTPESLCRAVRQVIANSREG